MLEYADPADRPAFEISASGLVTWPSVFGPGMRLAFLGNQDFTLWKFRGPWMTSLLRLGCEVTVLTPPGPYVSRLRAEGLRVREFSLNRVSASPLQELASLLELRRIIRQESPDLLHVFMAKPVIYGCLAAHSAPRTKIIATITGLGSIFAHARFSGMQFLLKNLYRLSLRRATRVIFQNCDDRDFFLRHRIVPQTKTLVIRGNGMMAGASLINHSIVQARTALDTAIYGEHPARPVTVILAGRLIEAKGVREYCRAAGLLRRDPTLPPLRFWLVGGNDAESPDAIDESELRALVQENGVVRFPHQENMREILAQSDIFCLPSYREGLSVACLEAMADGLPVITTEAPGCRDLVIPGKNGLLVPPGKVAPLAAAIRRLATNPKLRRNMGNCGREICLREFGATRIFPQLAGLYHRVLCPTTQRQDLITLKTNAAGDATRNYIPNVARDDNRENGAGRHDQYLPQQ